MDTRKLGAHGPEVPEQGLGCMGMTFAYTPGPSEDEAVRTICRAVELGVNFLDTADMYGPFTNEQLIARAIAGRRHEVVLASKVGNEIDAQGALTWHLNGRPEYIRAGIEGTLQRLGTDHVDLYYLHRVDPDVPVEESVGAMGELVAEGKVRAIGLSEASAATIRRAQAVHPLGAVQTEYSLLTRDVETNGVLETVRELGIGFVAYSPLCRGMLTGGIRETESLGEWDFRRIAPRFQGENLQRNLGLVDRVAALAARMGVTTSQVALAWVLAQSGVVALPGTKRRTRLEENVAASQIRLTAEDLAELDSIAPPGAAAGDRYPAGAMAQLER